MITAPGILDPTHIFTPLVAFSAVGVTLLRHAVRGAPEFRT